MSTGFNNEEQYIHQTTYTFRERIVGFFIFFGFVIFLFFIVVSVKNQHLFENRVTFYLNVDSSEGLGEGTIVKTLGAEIGRVSKLNLYQNGKIQVTIDIYQKHRTLIREGARAIVNRLTSIGNALIEIRSDSVDAPILAEGATIPVNETASLNDLLLSLANLIQVTDSKKLLGKVDTLLPKLEQTLGNVHAIIEKIASGRGTIGAAVFDQKVEEDLKVVVESGAKILSEAEGIIAVAKQRLVQIEPIVNDATYFVNDMRNASTSIPDLVKELHEIIAQANKALTLVNSELKEIPGTTIEIKRALAKTDNLLDSVQNTWPLSNNKTAQPVLIPAHSNHE
ncbi:MAG: MCE family protein [Methylococcales symbiont of Hymedesmia sp. n. MRB-2018]|nr:MAG: MCE family protein [Methylococcales symbiont of Hymedesmia sp. n. MRB-2018]KAF3983381.1 MAG: MCE family protein [Methylococcales symbiont of Hymedesmia sp. n. MRB-2018]